MSWRSIEKNPLRQEIHHRTLLPPASQPVQPESHQPTLSPPASYPVHHKYMKVHWERICPATLDHYGLSWRWDKVISPPYCVFTPELTFCPQLDSNFIIIKTWLPEHEWERLFEHTRQLNDEGERQKQQENKLARERPGDTGPEKAWAREGAGTTTTSGARARK